uniref:hypothetical protein n=1 Tax=Staphylococcus capitis TaxID=29388 RepID=UPI0016424E43
DCGEKEGYEEGIKDGEDIMKNSNDANINGQDMIKGLNNIKRGRDNLDGEEGVENEKESSNN